jgi:hypothetical protein
MKKELELMKDRMWMIELLTMEAMIKRPNHFKDLLKECNIEVEPNEEMQL